jgi:hypothetical protein
MNDLRKLINICGSQLAPQIPLKVIKITKLILVLNIAH